MSTDFTNNKILNCDACGEDFDSSITGSHLSLKIQESGITHDEAQKVLDMFGKMEFNTCWCCLIKSNGIKPKNEV